MTVGELRSKLESLPDSLEIKLIVDEDSVYQASEGEELDIKDMEHQPGEAGKLVIVAGLE